jgi:hypothetical protein
VTCDIPNMTTTYRHVDFINEGTRDLWNSEVLRTAFLCLTLADTREYSDPQQLDNFFIAKYAKLKLNKIDKYMIAVNTVAGVYCFYIKNLKKVKEKRALDQVMNSLTHLTHSHTYISITHLLHTHRQ